MTNKLSLIFFLIGLLFFVIACITYHFDKMLMAVIFLLVALVVQLVDNTVGNDYD